MGNNSASAPKDGLLEQYKLYVEMTDRLSSRRNDASKFYTTLLTALLALIPFVLEQGLISFEKKIALSGIGIMGAVLCFIWMVNINSYKQLASLKYKVIGEMEKELPYECYNREWQILVANNHNYHRLSKIESYVPILFGILCLMIAVTSAFFVY